MHTCSIVIFECSLLFLGLKVQHHVNVETVTDGTVGCTIDAVAQGTGSVKTDVFLEHLRVERTTGVGDRQQHTIFELVVELPFSLLGANQSNDIGLARKKSVDKVFKNEHLLCQSKQLILCYRHRLPPRSSGSL